MSQSSERCLNQQEGSKAQIIKISQLRNVWRQQPGQLDHSNLKIWQSNQTEPIDSERASAEGSSVRQHKGEIWSEQESHDEMTITDW